MSTQPQTIDNLSMDECDFLISKLATYDGEMSVNKVEGNGLSIAIGLKSKGLLKEGTQNIPSPFHRRFKFTREGRKLATQVTKEAKNY